MKFKKCRNDSKLTWNIIKDIFNNTHKQKIPDHMNVNQHKITDKQLIANHFNNYFSQIGTDMDNSIPVTFNIQDYLKSNFDTTFVFETVTVDTVKSIILGLKS